MIGMCAHGLIPCDYAVRHGDYLDRPICAVVNRGTLSQVYRVTGYWWDAPASGKQHSGWSAACWACIFRGAASVQWKRILISKKAPTSAPSGAPTTEESALTSGYLLVEALSPLPGPARRRPERPWLPATPLCHVTPPTPAAGASQLCGGDHQVWVWANARQETAATMAISYQSYLGSTGIADHDWRVRSI